jgi:transcriptional regulator with XRE-family HTH domain
MADAFIDWLVGELRARGWSHNRLAQEAGIAQSTISMIVSGRNRPGLDFCVGVARALDVTEVEVLRRAGLITAFEPDVDPLSMRRITELLKETTAAERKELLEIMYFHFKQLRRRRRRPENPDD